MSDFDFTLDSKRLDEYVARNGARCRPQERRPMPTGVSVPVRVGSVENGVTTTSLEAVDLYCLDAISLLRFLRLAPDDRKRPEYVVFALLGFTADEYVVADDAIATDDGVR